LNRPILKESASITNLTVATRVKGIMFDKAYGHLGPGHDIPIELLSFDFGLVIHCCPRSIEMGLAIVSRSLSRRRTFTPTRVHNMDVSSEVKL
jgi:hypothetical protein